MRKRDMKAVMEDGHYKVMAYEQLKRLKKNPYTISCSRCLLYTSKESGYYDLVAMQLAHGHSVSLIEGGDIKYVAELMDYYVDHGD